MAAGLGVGLAVFVVGLVATFAGPDPGRRVPGLAGMAGGALLVVAAAPPRPSLVVAGTVAATLVPLLLIALALHRRLVRRTAPGRASLDDDPR